MTDVFSVLNFVCFNRMHESDSFSKKNFGIIGPLANSSMKIQVYPEPNNGMIGYAMDEEEIEIFHGDKKLKIPNKSCEIHKKQEYSVIEIHPYTNWINSVDNREKLEDFVDDYINSRCTKEMDPSSQASADIQLILDILGLEENVRSCSLVNENSYLADLSNGMQIEIKKNSNEDLFKNFKIYKSADSNFPEVKIKRSGLGKVGVFKTKTGEFTEIGDSIKDLLRQPCTLYLMQQALGISKEDVGNELLSHYKKILKHHEPKKSKSFLDTTKYETEKGEIDRIKQMLRNSFPEESLERIYNESRGSK